MRRMRVAAIGCVEASFALIERLLELPSAELVGVVSRSRSRFHSDFRSLAPLAAQAGAPWLDTSGRDQEELGRFLAAQRPEVVYCFGWPYLLHREVLAVPPLGCIGYHPAKLPEHRGRHPIIWALALGLESTASSFFFMDEGPDSGDLLSQREVAISPRDDAGSLYARLVEVGRRQVAEFTPRLAAGTHVRRPQDPDRAGWWRKRGEEDGRIDWRMSAPVIHNLVRALARPYPGAHWDHGGRPVKVWRSRPEAGPVPRDLEPGRVLAAGGDGLVVKCGEGAIHLLEHELDRLPEPGSYLS